MNYFFSLILIIIFSINLLANVAAPSQGGQTLTEPSGTKTIDIVKEDLNIDFSQLGDEQIPYRDRLISVEAIYNIENPADLENLDLVFVIVSDAKNFQFFLDETEIPTTTIDNNEFADRQSWKKPEKTPYEDREIMYNPYNGNLKSAKFTIKIPKGKHKLKALYKAEPTIYKNIGIMKGWQFAYSLAPANDWKSFGELNLTLKIPQNWKLYTNLKLDKNEQAYIGKFEKIPKDFLAITTQAPVPANYNFWTDFTFFTFLGFIFIFPILIVILAITKGYKLNNSWIYGFVAGAIWALLVGISGYFSQSFPKSLIPEGQYATYGYDDLFGTFFIVLLIPVIFVLGIAFWVIPVLLKNKKVTK